MIVAGVAVANAQKVGENFIIFEAEDTPYDLGLWKIITPSDSNYFHNPEGIAPTSESFLEFTGDTNIDLKGQTPLQYKFTCPKTGEYRCAIRMHQRREGLAEDRCNDVFVRMEGNFTSNSPSFTNEELMNNMKFFGRGLDDWGCCHSGQSDVTKINNLVLYNLIEGEKYTFTISGRSQRVQLDYFICFETSLPIIAESYKDLAASNDKKYLPDTRVCKTIKAVDFKKITDIESFKDAEIDEKNDKKILSIGERSAWSAAQVTYKGRRTNAFFKLNTMKETDGESTYILKVNGVEVGRCVNDKIHGTGVADYTVQTHVINRQGFSIKKGDVIQVEFYNSTYGLVPEGELTATARGHWIGIEICSVE